MNIFFTMNPETLISCIRSAKQSILIQSPGITNDVADNLSEVNKSGIKIIIITKIEEESFRQGYGDFSAIEKLRKNEISLLEDKSIDIGLLIIDELTAYIFTPIPRAIADVPACQTSQNAMIQQGDWVREYYKSVASKVITIENGMELPIVSTAITIIGQEIVNESDATPASSSIPQVVMQAAVPQPRIVNEEKVKLINGSLERVPIQEFDLNKRLNIYTNQFQYIEMTFINSKTKSQSVNLDKVLVIRDYPPDLVKRFNTAFKVFNGLESKNNKLYLEKYREIREKYIASIEGRGNLYLLENKTKMESELTELNKLIDDTKSELFESLNTQVTIAIDNIIQELSKDTLTAYRNAHDIRIQLNDEFVLDEIKHSLRKVLYRKINSIIDKTEIKYYFKDITYDDIKDPDFVQQLKCKFKGIDWNKFDPVSESITVQPKTKKYD